MSRQTSNWVDRGDTVEEPLARVLATALDVPPHDPRLIDVLQVVRVQLDASATEGEVAKYVGTLFPLFARPVPDTPTLRLLGTALWHIAKIGLMREQAQTKE